MTPNESHLKWITGGTIFRPAFPSAIFLECCLRVWSCFFLNFGESLQKNYIPNAHFEWKKQIVLRPYLGNVVYLHTNHEFPLEALCEKWMSYFEEYSNVPSCKLTVLSKPWTPNWIVKTLTLYYLLSEIISHLISCGMTLFQLVVLEFQTNMTILYSESEHHGMKKSL